MPVPLALAFAAVFSLSFLLSLFKFLEYLHFGKFKHATNSPKRPFLIASSPPQSGQLSPSFVTVFD